MVGSAYHNPEVPLRAKSAFRDERVFPEPYWGYEDIGIFFVLLVTLTPVFHLPVHFHLPLRSERLNPNRRLNSQCEVGLALRNARRGESLCFTTAAACHLGRNRRSGHCPAGSPPKLFPQLPQ